MTFFRTRIVGANGAVVEDYRHGITLRALRAEIARVRREGRVQAVQLWKCWAPGGYYDFPRLRAALLSGNIRVNWEWAAGGWRNDSGEWAYVSATEVDVIYRRPSARERHEVTIIMDIENEANT